MNNRNERELLVETGRELLEKNIVARTWGNTSCEIKGTYQHAPEEHYQFGDVLFECKHLTRKDGRVKDVSFSLRKGEILGFSGLVGAGRSETMCAIYGAAPIASGEVWLNGKQLHIKNPYSALRQGIGLVTENRRESCAGQGAVSKSPTMMSGRQWSGAQLR